MAGPSYEAQVRIRMIGEDYVSGPANRVAFSLNRILTITAGIAITRAIFALGRAVSDLAKQAWDAAAEFQTLQIRYEGLIARQMTGLNTGENFAAMLGEQTEMADWQIDTFSRLRDQYDKYKNEVMRLIETGEDEGAYYESVVEGMTNYAVAIQQSIPGFEDLTLWQKRAAFGNLDMRDALEQAIGPANELIEWTKRMAVTTPFTVETLSRANTLGMAMGFNIDQTKRLTLATGNFTAGMGLSQEVIERIIYNFGQMQMQGKVTGTELRDLARGGFVPVTDVLKQMQKNLGATGQDFDDFRKDAAKGIYPVGEFFTAFMEIAERDFPNAMERMSRTWEGVTSNIHDFFSAILGAEMLGPLVDRLSEKLANALDRIMSPDVRSGFKELGIAIADAFELIMDKGKELMGAIGEVLDTLGIEPSFGGLENMINGIADALGWLIDRATGAAEKLNSLLTPAVELFSEKIEDAGDVLAPFIEPIKEFAEEHGIKFADVVNDIVENLMLVGGAAVGIQIAAFALKAIGFIVGKLNVPLMIITSLISGLALAWNQNWFGMRDTLTEVWEGTIKPAFEDLQLWFGTELPSLIEGWKNTIGEKMIEAGEKVDLFILKSETLSKISYELNNLSMDDFVQIWEDLKGAIGEVYDWFLLIGDFFSSTLGPAFEGVGGVIDTMLGFALENLRIIFEALAPLLETVGNIFGSIFGPILENVVAIVTEHLLPAFQQGYDIFKNYIVPVIIQIGENVGKMIEVFMEFGKGVLEAVVIPAIETVRDFFVDHIIPAVGSVLEVVGALAEKFGEFAEAFINNVFLPAMEDVREWIEDKVKPALEKVSDFIEEHVSPAIETLSEWVNEELIPALKDLAEKILEPLREALDKVGGAVDKVTGFFKDLAGKIRNIKLPKWLQSDSPTPLEMGLLGINAQLEDFHSLLGYVAKDVNRMPQVDNKLGGLNGAFAGATANYSGGGTNVGNMNFYVYDAQDADAVADKIMLKLKQLGLRA